ncbi:hypothetical protein Cylst_2337 [Cylindrospermum stagnale PCC 7417]|uniref:Uncharacterized protein n=1 Tax=Cylindrospermum stagnale PCC 7417 TaxID=56107 RepID=K9WXQ4_9NOST|nr:hypothetical protein [Cylindrospermum stagnale]AFZ24566.1 hypothetical protein Cylst_2337 [Cylindrospermum stagnale PCC 7417]
MNGENKTSNQPCYFFEFGLIVTGEIEEQHPEVLEPFTAEQYRFHDGILSAITRQQLDDGEETPTA